MSLSQLLFFCRSLKHFAGLNFKKMSVSAFHVLACLLVVKCVVPMFCK